MRVLVVDDEPLARTALTDVLARRADVEHFDIASDAIEALEKLTTESYDILLLDVNMPELSGTELLDHLRKRGDDPLPSIVFVTAHDKHAVAAFENHAVDYVLKPFSNDRIGEALERACRRAERERAAKLIEALPQLEKLPRTQHARIAVKANGKILFINPANVSAVIAQGNYVLLQQDVGSYLLRESISLMTKKLKPYGFIRIHRSVLVNRSFVEELKSYLTGEYGLRIRGGKEYTVTRTYKQNLGCLADCWIGSGAFLSDHAIARDSK